MVAYEKNFPVTWEELHRNAKALAWRLNSLGPFKGIISVTRGGLVPAAVVARELEIRLIDTICISSYEGDKQEELNKILVDPDYAESLGVKVYVRVEDNGDKYAVLNNGQEEIELKLNQNPDE